MDPLVRNNVTVAGNATAARSMVFVNGLGYDQSFWRSVTPSFAGDYRLVLFDHAGSVPSNQAYFCEHQYRYLNIGGYADDLLEVCTALNLAGEVGEVVVVGHSLGALAALLASIQRPALFDRLVLVGASPRYLDADGYRGGFSREAVDATYAALTAGYHGWSNQLAAAAMATPDRPVLIDTFAQSLRNIPQEMMLTILCSVLQTDQRSSLAKVSVPTLIIQSQNDCFVPPEVADYIHAGIAGSQLTVIDAQGHLPHVSAPDAVIAAIRGFIG